MRNDVALVSGAIAALPVFTITPEAVQAKENALLASALIGKVTNQAQNDAAVQAMTTLKSLSSGFEAQRKKYTEPLLEAQRQLKRVTDTQRDELDRELGRLEVLVKDFVIAEQRRVREEQEAQQRELERIERERQAELARVAREQAEAERKAREEREAAERAAREATNKKEREAAAKLQAEAAERERIAKEQAEEATRRANEEADTRARIESKPVEITRTAGQQVRKQWAIKQINDFQLLKARPDLVRKIEWDMVAIKDILNAGGKLPGVIAEEDLRVGVRARPAMQAIEV